MRLNVFAVDRNLATKVGTPLGAIEVPDDADEDGILNELHFHYPTFDVRFAGIGVPFLGYDIVLGADNMPIYALKVADAVG